MRTLLGMQYGGNVPQQYPRQPIPPQQFQEGGGVSSGLAFLKRGKKRKKAYDEARKTEGRLGRKMGKGRTWGSLLGIGGGLLGAAALGALGFTPAGIPLAIAAGLGTAAGKYGGSRLGYGKDLKTKDMMYGEEAGIEDIAEAGESYRGQMSQEALLSGAKAALMAGFAPNGGMYGKAAKFGEKAAGVGQAADVVGTVSQVADLGTQVTPETEIANRAMRSQAFQPQSGSMAVPDLKHLTQNIPSAPGSLLGTGAGELAPEIATEAADILGAQSFLPEGFADSLNLRGTLLGETGGYDPRGIVDNTGISFQDAFRRARQQFGGGGTFDWRGNPYSTAYAP